MFKFLFGHDAQGREVRAEPSSLFIFGDTGSGKSSTLAMLGRQALDRGCRVLLADPDALHAEGLTRLMGVDPTSPDVASTPEDIAVLIHKARLELDSRIDADGKGAPVIVAVDEWLAAFPEIRGRTHPAVADLEAIVTRGRRRNVFAWLISQGVTAGSNVPPWLRDVMAGSIVHGGVPRRTLHLALGTSRWTGPDPATLPVGQAIMRLPHRPAVTVRVPQLASPPPPPRPAPRLQRERNVAAVLGCLQEHGGRHPVRELARLSGVRPATAARVVSQLLADGRLVRHPDGVELAPWATEEPARTIVESPDPTETPLPRPEGLDNALTAARRTGEAAAGHLDQRRAAGLLDEARTVAVNYLEPRLDSIELGISELGLDSPDVRQHLSHRAELLKILEFIEAAGSPQMVAGLLQRGKEIVDGPPYPAWTAERERRIREQLEAQRAALLAQRSAASDDWIWMYLRTMGPMFEVPLDAGREMTLSIWRDRPHLPGQRGCQPPALARQSTGSNGGAYCAECPAWWRLKGGVWQPANGTLVELNAAVARHQREYGPDPRLLPLPEPGSAPAPPAQRAQSRASLPKPAGFMSQLAAVLTGSALQPRGRW